MSEFLLWESLGEIPDAFFVDALPPSWRQSGGVSPARRRWAAISEFFLDNGWVAAVLSVTVALGLIAGIASAGRIGTHNPAGTRPPTQVTANDPAVSDAESVSESDAESISESDTVVDSETIPASESDIPYEPAPPLEEMLELWHTGIDFQSDTMGTGIFDGYLHTAYLVSLRTEEALTIRREPLTVEKLQALAEGGHLSDYTAVRASDIYMGALSAYLTGELLSTTIYDEAFTLMEGVSVNDLGAGVYYVVCEFKSTGVFNWESSMDYEGSTIHSMPFCLRIHSEPVTETETYPVMDSAPPIDEMLTECSGIEFTSDFMASSTDMGYLQSADLVLASDPREPLGIWRENITSEQLRALAEGLYFPTLDAADPESIRILPLESAGEVKLWHINIYDSSFNLLDTATISTLRPGKYYVVCELQTTGDFFINNRLYTGTAMYLVPFGLSLNQAVYDPPIEETETVGER